MSLKGDPTDPVATCSGKHRFTSHGRARKAATRSAHRHCERIAPYHCPHCSGWHIGSHLHRRK